ncbi:MAG: hypothetical protein FWE20_12645 [Defluviitaleaceae bacterium]|nr:hypothetical protein [Defluviitaleaceae bacterium]
MKTTLKYSKRDIKALYHEELREYEARIGDMSAEEQKDLRKWVSDGHSPYENPCLFCDDDGHVMEYIQAVRIWEDMVSNPDDYIRRPDLESGDKGGFGDEIPF